VVTNRRFSLVLKILKLNLFDEFVSVFYAKHIKLTGSTRRILRSNWLFLKREIRILILKNMNFELFDKNVHNF